jgi:hypothetical protein
MANAATIELMMVKIDLDIALHSFSIQKNRGNTQCVAAIDSGSADCRRIAISAWIQNSPANPPLGAGQDVG